MYFVCLLSCIEERCDLFCFSVITWPSALRQKGTWHDRKSSQTFSEVTDSCHLTTFQPTTLCSQAKRTLWSLSPVKIRKQLTYGRSLIIAMQDLYYIKDTCGRPVVFALFGIELLPECFPIHGRLHLVNCTFIIAYEGGKCSYDRSGWSNTKWAVKSADQLFVFKNSWDLHKQQPVSMETCRSQLRLKTIMRKRVVEFNICWTCQFVVLCYCHNS